MNIGEAARRSGVSAKMIRHYESIDLIPRVLRTEAGYRVYTEDGIHTLRFIRRARDLGFPIDRIRILLALWQDRERSNADVRRVAMDHVTELKQRIGQMQAMAATLEHLAHCCAEHGDRPSCPILDNLGNDQA